MAIPYLLEVFEEFFRWVFVRFLPNLTIHLAIHRAK